MPLTGDGHRLSAVLSLALRHPRSASPSGTAGCNGTPPRVVCSAVAEAPFLSGRSFSLSEEKPTSLPSQDADVGEEERDANAGSRALLRGAHGEASREAVGGSSKPARARVYFLRVYLSLT